MTKVWCLLLQHLHKSGWTLVRFEKNSLGYWHMFLKSFDIATSSCVTKPRHETFIISFYSMLALIFCVRHKIFRAVLIWPHCYIFSDTFVKCKDQYLHVVIQFWVYSSTCLIIDIAFWAQIINIMFLPKVENRSTRIV